VFGLTATFGMTSDGGWPAGMHVSSVAHSSRVRHQQTQLTFHGSGVGKDGWGVLGLRIATQMVLRLALHHGHAMGKIMLGVRQSGLCIRTLSNSRHNQDCRFIAQ